ncbi:MAG: TonB-dependent receptor [Pseudomonadales bacterium]|nr:TonB-dependent receptor [Pseudomonadales bacterium]
MNGKDKFLMARGYCINILIAAFVAGWSCISVAQQSNIPPEEIRVQGERLYYSLSDNTSPVLIYDKEFFQSFEPQSVGDMLKRVSGVAFTSDIGEFEAPQLRGLGPEYTQVLINGERIPGVTDDRVALVDRIPAELIDRIEVIRSPTADIDSQGLGGTINLILKDGAELQGSEWRLGGIFYPDIDPTTKGSAAITLADTNNAWSYLLSLNTQERLGPKTKSEFSYNEAGELQQVFSSDDIRESTDNSLFGNLSYKVDNEESLSVRFGYVGSQIDEIEEFQIHDEEFELEESGLERRDSEQERWDLGFSYDKSVNDDLDFRFSLSGSQFRDDTEDLEALIDEGVEEIELLQSTDIEDLDLQTTAGFSYRINSEHRIEFGFGANKQEREANQRIFERDEDDLVDVSPGNGIYRVEESKRFIFLKDIWDLSNSSTLELGLRGEDTELSQRGSNGLSSETQFEFNPSAHYFREIGSNGQLRVSLAKTLRRPNFTEIIPFVNRDSPSEDQVTIGNPSLHPEVALGLDVGYSHSFDNSGGILGLNFFYRDIEDKIELTQIGEDTFSPENVGNGEAWGLEIDFGMPLTFVGLPQLSFFTNYSYIDSEIKDPFTNQTRRFNLQPNYIANVDLIHSFDRLGINHGISFQKQGKVRDLQFDETKQVSYGANLEYFIEKTIGENLTLRFSANNLLDAEKRERGLIYDGLNSFLDGELEERVFEWEESEPVFLITVRGTF